MECWAIFQRTNQESQRLNFAMLNHIQDQMDDIVGLPRRGPRIQVPMPTYVASAPITMNTTNNIHVESGSQVGQINAGAIVSLDRAVSSFNDAGLRETASALQSFTQQVVDSHELSAESQSEVLNLLRAVVEQQAKKKEERNPSIVKLALQNVGLLLSAATTIASHWEPLKVALESLFR
jgi:hypothetical protein